MTDEPESEDQAYFHAIEKTFIRLRGAPLLLSPSDWRMAQSWRRAGIPLELVEEALETVFHRREKRGAKGRVQSLRYCREAVETAWEELQELVAPSRRDEAETVDAAAQLELLVKALPDVDVVERLDLGNRIRAIDGAMSEREKALGALESEVYAAVAADLSKDERKALEQRVDTVLADLPEPLEGLERDRAAERLRRQILRRRMGLPQLTLFN